MMRAQTKLSAPTLGVSTYRAPVNFPPPAVMLPMPSAGTQYQFGDCCSYTVAEMIRFARSAQKLQDVGAISPLYLYWFARRQLEPPTTDDVGSTMAEVIQAALLDGYASETEWPTTAERVSDVAPTGDVIAVASKRKLKRRWKVPLTLTGIKHTLAARYPVGVVAFYPSAIGSDAVAATGICPMPPPHDAGYCHAALAIGYDDDAKLVTIRNSFGATWGQAGDFTLPYAFFTSTYLREGWVITEVSGP